MEKKLIISPKTKVGELLEAYPFLEPVLISMSPAFEKLRNPVLRKTVARVATLQQVSVVGGVNLEVLIRKLRQEAGQDHDEIVTGNAEYHQAEAPGWFDPSRVMSKYDATPVINAGDSPMQEILKLATALGPESILELKTPFMPAPIIDMLKGKSFRTYSIVNNQGVVTYISR